MKKSLCSYLEAISMMLLSAFLASNAVAAEVSGSNPMYDESAYTAQMEKDMKKLDMLYLKYNDKSIPSGEVAKAKREYFKIAREILSNMNERFDKLDPKKGATLSGTEMLLMNHIQVMLIDMLANIHQSEWLAGDESATY